MCDLIDGFNSKTLALTFEEEKTYGSVFSFVEEINCGVSEEYFVEEIETALKASNVSAVGEGCIVSIKFDSP